MSDLNLKLLIDKALDVDPDLRFMALEDYRRYLQSQQKSAAVYSGYNSVETFLPTLFRLLEDHNSDVQSQAIKSFEPTVKLLSNEAILKVIDQLYTLVLKENDPSKTKGQYKSFTMSIPNVALRSILDNKEEYEDHDRVLTEPTKSSKSSKSRKPSTSTFDSRLSRAVIDSLLPRLVSNPVTYDSIEILLDLIKNLGTVLTNEELSSLMLYLLETSFKEVGIVSKRAIHGFGLLFNYIDEPAIVNDSVKAIRAHGKSSTREIIYIKSQLYSVVLGGSVAMYTSLVDEIFEELKSNLKVSEKINTDEDLDYDKLLEDNLIREDSLTVVNDLILSNNSTERFASDLLQIIEFFITYNPLQDNEDDDMVDFDEDDEDDIVFSDDENEIENQEDDDGSWKLRLKSCIIARSYLDRFSDSLQAIYSNIFSRIPINDKNELVFNEAIKTMILIIDTSVDRQPQLDNLEKVIMDKLLIESRQSHFPKVLQLIESLNRFNEYHLIQTTFQRFNELEISTSGSLSYLGFYRNVLETASVHSDTPLDSRILEYISNDLINSLEDKSFNVVIESIRISSALFKYPHHESIKKQHVDAIVASLVSKIENSKKYSSDLIQLSVQCLGDVLNNNLYDNYRSLEDVFVKCFAFENTARINLEVLISLGLSNHPILTETPDFQHKLLLKLQDLILSRDETIHNSSMMFLAIMVSKCTLEDSTRNKLFECILQLFNLEDSVSFNSSYNVFEILSTLYDESIIIAENKNQLFAAIVKLVNTDKIHDDNQDFYSLISKISHGNPGLFDQTKAQLDLNSQVSSKILAIISIENNLQNKVAELESQFLNITKESSTRSSKNPDLLFAVQFLGNIGEHQTFGSIGLENFLELLNEPNEDFQPLKTNEKNLNNDDLIKKAAATAIGKIIKFDISESFEKLLNHYQDSQYERSRPYLSQSFILALPKINPTQLDLLWKSVWSVINSTPLSHSVCGDLRSAGDLLSEISLIKKDYIDQVIEKSGTLQSPDQSQPQELSKAYTIIVIIKKLLNKLTYSTSTADVLTTLLGYSIHWLPILNIDIKQLIVGNLLTGLHNQPTLILNNLNKLILPSIYEQLKSQPEFKKVIPMGPYKFVIDEGLEIRKLTYEFLFTLISSESFVLEDHDVDLKEILINIVNQGLVDEQNDIIVLASLNLINLITNHESKFREFLVENDSSVSHQMIQNIRVQLGKKLSAKASSQDVESYEERVKSIIKLSKLVSQVIRSISDSGSPDNLLGGWTDVIEEIKAKFPIFYNTIE